LHSNPLAAILPLLLPSIMLGNNNALVKSFHLKQTQQSEKKKNYSENTRKQFEAF
jgi:hypothetical protein